MHQREDVVREAYGVGVVLLDLEIGLVYRSPSST